MSDQKWDKRFLTLAEHIAGWSKDPRTQVGAVITDYANRLVSVGYNGFPRGVHDHPERYANRELKLKMIVHAERNAILLAGRCVKNCVLYTWPFAPCSVCAGIVIQSGIAKVVAPKLPDNLLHWKEDLEIAGMMFEEADVEVEFYGGDGE